jgi:zinc protease
MSVVEASQQPAAAADAVVVQFEKYRLENGLDVILSEDHRLPVVAINVWYHVGPAYEKPGQTGFAHLFEHMMFQGSKHVGEKPIKVLETAGATQINGTTGFDRTNYFETVPADKLEFGLWFESDRMAWLLDTLTARNLANQRDVVRNERRQGENQPYKLVEEELFRQLFPGGHPYHASIIGSHADIELARLEDMRGFCAQYYVPNNASLVLVGDLDPAEAKQLVQKYFGPIPAGNPVPKVENTTPPITQARRVTVTDRVELARIYKAWLTAPIFSPGDTENNLLGHILGGGPASRLYQKLVHEKQMAQDVTAYNQSLMLGSVFMICATARPQVALEDLEKALDEELAAIQREGPLPEEVERARNSSQANHIFALEEPGGINGLADRLNTYNHYLGDPGYLAQDLARYDAVSVADVQRVARSLAPEASVTVRGVPGPKVLNDVAKRDDIDVDIENAVSVDEDWRRSVPQSQVRALSRPPVPVRMKLANGLDVLFLEQNHVPGISASFVTVFGNAASPSGLDGLGSFTATMLARGTERRSLKELASDVERIGAQLFAQSKNDFSAVKLRWLKKNRDAGFALLSDVVQKPAFSTEEVERVRHERLVWLLQLRENPAAVVQKEFLAELYGPEHPYGRMDVGTETSNKTTSRNDLMDFHTRAYKPQGAALVLVGALTENEAQTLAEKHFGGWSGGSPVPQAPGALPVGSRRIVIVDRPGSPQTQLAVGSIGVERSHPDLVAIELMNAILGGTFSSRINTNLREVHGYTYGAKSGFTYLRGRGPFLISAAVRTDSTAASISEVFHEISQLRETLVTAEELAIVKESFSRALLSQFKSIRESTDSISNLFVHHLGLEHYQEMLDRVSAVRLSEVQEMAKQHLQPESMIIVAVGDASKIEWELRRMNLGPVRLSYMKAS